jgi:hypothetical protein
MFGIKYNPKPDNGVEPILELSIDKITFYKSNLWPYDRYDTSGSVCSVHKIPYFNWKWPFIHTREEEINDLRVYFYTYRGYAEYTYKDTTVFGPGDSLEKIHSYLDSQYRLWRDSRLVITYENPNPECEPITRVIYFKDEDEASHVLDHLNLLIETNRNLNKSTYEKDLLPIIKPFGLRLEKE